jgi:hypothetical protein
LAGSGGMPAGTSEPLLEDVHGMVEAVQGLVQNMVQNMIQKNVMQVQ